MILSKVPFTKTSFLSKFVLDYLQSHKLDTFFGKYPDVEELEKQSRSQIRCFSDQNRATLVKQLQLQYQDIQTTQSVIRSINSLKKKNTVTITTGHQLCLLSGPLYVIYKAVSAINLCKIMSERCKDINFVPIFWMATEDHDFEEISFFESNGKKFKWNRESKSFTGELDLTGLSEVLNLYEAQLGHSQKANTVKKLISKSYRSSKNLSEATLKFLNQLFSNYGLLILDPNRKEFKRQFVPYIENELFELTCSKGVDHLTKKLKENYNSKFTPPVNPLEINLFFKHSDGRLRIVPNKNHFEINGANTRITFDELKKILKKHPEKFSPNVLTRPLYQQVILPNICYIGGPSEVAYWLQLKDYFDSQSMIFPKILLRNSALLLTQKQSRKITKLNLKDSDLFIGETALINKHIRAISNIDLDLNEFQELLKKQFEYLSDLVEKTDGSFAGVVAAQQKKQFKGIEKLEKRLLKAQKRKLRDEVQRLSILYSNLFPENKPQERVVNFTQFYLMLGTKFIDLLIDNLDPLSKEITVIRLDC